MERGGQSNWGGAVREGELPGVLPPGDSEGSRSEDKQMVEAGVGGAVGSRRPQRDSAEQGDSRDLKKRLVSHFKMFVKKKQGWPSPRLLGNLSHENTVLT